MTSTEVPIPTYAQYPHYAQTVASFRSIDRRLLNEMVVTGTDNIPGQFIGFSNHHSPRGLIWADIVNTAIAYDIAQEQAEVPVEERKVIRFVGKSTLFNPNLSMADLLAKRLGSAAPKAGEIATKAALGAVKHITGMELDKLDFAHILGDGLAALALDRPRDTKDGSAPDTEKIKAIYRTAQHNSLHLFAEGTVSHPSDGQLLPFEEGSFRIAKASKQPLLPISLVYGNTGPSGVVGQDLLVSYDAPFEIDRSVRDFEIIQKEMQKKLHADYERFREIFGYKPGQQPKSRVLKKIILN